jgi:hypothetical protein
MSGHVVGDGCPVMRMAVQDMWMAVQDRRSGCGATQHVVHALWVHCGLEGLMLERRRG